MHRFEKTRLWQCSLAEQQDDDSRSKADRERLRNAYMNLRGRVATLVSKISEDMPEFTIHDISHIDALWEMAGIIAGENIQLTPTEGFVLGGAFLLHDAGMTLSSYPDGIKTLQEDPLWQDYAASWKRKNEDKELDPKHLAALVMRERHAQHAQDLLNLEWESPSGPNIRLLEDSELLNTYGQTIGKIASSHWSSVDEIAKMFRYELGAPGDYSHQWKVDPLKIACLLRVADAAHLDDRRAPSFLLALNQPNGLSKDHWLFQSKLLQPQLKKDEGLLQYTSRHPFKVSESNAWWICYEVLHNFVDRELREVDRLLTLSNKARFAAKGVCGAESINRLSEYIPTEGWEPIDTKLQVTDVVGLVEKLGGRELYGDNPHAPLRELIQNASDAIRSRRILENRSEDWGEINVRIGKDEYGDWLEVEDSGIGMSRNVLTGPLLDFGQSFWNSELSLRELPGLSTAGFVPTGKYGIGFFSIFMLGERVKISSRRYDEGQKSTLVLEFNAGLGTRPILRSAKPAEHFPDGGTRIRVWLNKDPIQERGLLFEYPQFGTHWTLKQLCSWIAPSLEINLKTQVYDAEPELSVRSSDWIDISGRALVDRIWGKNNRDTDACAENIAIIEDNLRVIRDEDGKIIGRICLLDRQGDVHCTITRGVITTNGIRAGDLNGIVGVLKGLNYKIDRSNAIPEFDASQLTNWIEEQKELLKNTALHARDLRKCAQIVRWLGAKTDDLKIAINDRKWVSATEIEEKFSEYKEVIVVSPPLFVDKEILYEKYVLVVQPERICTIIGGLDCPWPTLPESPIKHWDSEWPTLHGAIAEALAKAWDVSLEELAKVSHFGAAKDGKEKEREFRFIGKDITNHTIRDEWQYCYVFRNPKYALENMNGE